MTTHTTDQIAHSTVHTILADDRRRKVIRHLESADDETPIEELARALTASEPSNLDVDEMYQLLRHEHIPLLDRNDIVEYDADERTVYTGPVLSMVVEVLQASKTAYNEMSPESAH